MKTSLIVEKDDQPPFVWTKRFEKRGYWGLHPVGRRFDRRKVGDWIIAIVHLWRTAEQVGEDG